jgi:uncharacterized linocin/CFP29 family protein
MATTDTDKNVPNLGWTDDQWMRVQKVIAEEALRSRVLVSFLPVVGPLHPSTVAVPGYAITQNAPPAGALGGPVQRLEVDSRPNLDLHRISTLVYLRGREAAEPDLAAALGLFRRSANYIAQVEDSLVLLGHHPGVAGPPPRNQPIAPMDQLVQLGAANNVCQGLLSEPLPIAGAGAVDANGRRIISQLYAAGTLGPNVVTAVIRAIGQLESNGHFGPFACVLSTDLFDAVCTPVANLSLPRDRILPFVDGQLFRSNQIPAGAVNGTFYGVVVALGGSPVELVVASDIYVSLLQASLEPRWVFRVSERVALRIKEFGAIAVLRLHL